jgi:hypothetical protein
LRWQSGGQDASVLVEDIHIERLMELGCMAFAALCVGDSGANLSSIQTYEEPEDMEEQLGKPERLNLRHKLIKLRAAGREVPVHLTSTTVTRLRAYLRLREALRVRLDCPDVAPMFVQCEYPIRSWNAKPTGIAPLAREFTRDVRSRFRAVGIDLPHMTMQRLRAFKQGKVSQENNPKVAADLMGHTVTSAIRKYNNITEAESRSEMAPFLASLSSIVRSRSESTKQSSKRDVPITPIPPGGCKAHGNPIALSDSPLVEPDCKKTEGCFFCNKLNVHAEEEDAIKLMSCRAVLERLAPRLGDNSAVGRVYAAVIDRIGALLGEIKRIHPEAHESARVAVLEAGQLSRYWAGKLQQLHLLGLLAPPSGT